MKLKYKPIFLIFLKKATLKSHLQNSNKIEVGVANEIKISPEKWNKMSKNEEECKNKNQKIKRFIHKIPKTKNGN